MKMKRAIVKQPKTKQPAAYKMCKLLLSIMFAVTLCLCSGNVVLAAGFEEGESYAYGYYTYMLNDDGTSLRIIEVAGESQNTHLKIPESFTYDGRTLPVTKVSSGAINGLSNLISLEIPDTIEMAPNSVKNCKNLETIYPEGYVDKHKNVFYNCTKLNIEYDDYYDSTGIYLGDGTMPSLATDGKRPYISFDLDHYDTLGGFDPTWGDLWARYDDGDNFKSFREWKEYVNDPENNCTVTDIKGISYDEKTNTLTLNNLNYPTGWFNVSRMGSSFKIKLIGDNYMERFDICANGYGCSVEFIGTGTLHINSRIDKSVPKLRIGDNVSIQSYYEIPHVKQSIKASESAAVIVYAAGDRFDSIVAGHHVPNESYLSVSGYRNKELQYEDCMLDDELTGEICPYISGGFVLAGNQSAYEAAMEKLNDGYRRCFSSNSLSPIEYPYTGNPVIPNVIVKNALGEILTEGTHYRLEYWKYGSDYERVVLPECVDIGDYYYDIIGIGECEGQEFTYEHFTISDEVEPANLFKTIVMNQTSYPYTGQPIKPTVQVYDTLDRLLTEGTDYWLDYFYDSSVNENGSDACVDPGAYIVMAVGQGSYEGSNLGMKYTITKEAACAHDFGTNNEKCSICGEPNPDYKAPTQDKTQSTTPVDNKSAVSSDDGQKVTTTAKSEATVTELKESTKKSVSVPATIKVDGVSYKVTTIAENAFQNCPKATTVTLPKTVKKINANAFAKSKISTVKVTIEKGKKITVNKNAFKKSKVKKIQLTMSKKATDAQKKAAIKAFTKAGIKKENIKVKYK